jgi:hypothetical protein
MFIMALPSVQAPSESALRQRAWRARRRRERRQLCADCGGIFVPARRDAAFCSFVCKQRAWRAHRKRKASGETAPPRPTEPPWREFEAVRPPHASAKPEAASGAAQRPAVHTKSGRVVDIRSMIG